MGARNQYSSINFLSGFIEGISMVNFFVGHFYTVVFGCGEITSKTSTMCKMHIAVARAMQLCTHLSLLSRQTKNPLVIAAWKPWVTHRRWKIQGDIRHGILPKIIVPTSVTYCAFITLWKFYSDDCLKPFLRIPKQYFVFGFSPKKDKPTQSATIFLTLWIYRTEDKLQSCILVWRDSKKRCVHWN